MYVCICNGVTDTQIKKAIKDGKTTYREIRETLNVGTQCGQCSHAVRQIIAESNFELEEKINNLCYAV